MGNEFGMVYNKLNHNLVYVLTETKQSVEGKDKFES
jgi:hypothetical protein